MTGTLINEQNSDLFLSGIPDEALLTSDIFFGVIDDDTATACGVLAAESIGDHIHLWKRQSRWMLPQ